MTNNIITYTSLFSCAGIGETFLRDIGLISTVSNELLGDRATWYQSKYPETTMVPGDIMDDEVFNKLVKLHIEKGNSLSLMSPPCQDFSNAGARDHSNPRAFLYQRALEFIKAVDSTNRHVFIENVPAFLTAKINGKITVKEEIKKALYQLGYKYIIAGMLDCSNYGVPQHRPRCFIIASKDGLWRFPEPDKEPIKTIRDAIGDLPSLEAGKVSDILYHYAPYWPKRYTDVMKHTPTGETAFLNHNNWVPRKEDGELASYYRSAWRRADWDKPCGTILMKSAGMGGMITCHPGRKLDDGTYSDARAFTIKELLRLTGLPDSYRIPAFALNNDELIRDVIGECVCPLMERKIMEMLPR